MGKDIDDRKRPKRVSRTVETEQRTIQVGNEAVPFEAIIGRNVPRRVEREES